jgi:ubiquinone/menaquinone biosynthesis C-methylase UbiE
LIQQARLERASHVLDLGCGTAALALRIKYLYPDSDVVGLDGDADILAIAKAKAAQARLRIRLDYGQAQQLPYADGSFERVLSSLVLHHLSRVHKQQALQEAYRVLTPDGNCISLTGQSRTRRSWPLLFSGPLPGRLCNNRGQCEGVTAGPDGWVC